MGDKTVLVIEDNELNMKLVQSLLQLGNYKVLKASYAEGGIEMARKHKPDLILMDLQLPGIDGLKAAQIIKADSSLAEIPIVVITARAMEVNDERVLEAGCTGYITKPIDTRSFLETIGLYLSRAFSASTKNQ